MILQFLKFALVGASNAAVYLGVYYLFILISDNIYMAMAGQAVAWFSGVSNSFFWNRKFVFSGSKEIFWRALIKNYMGYGFGLLLSTLSTYIQIELLNVPTAIVPIINLPLIGPINFLIIKYWTFKDKTKYKNSRTGVRQGVDQL